VQSLGDLGERGQCVVLNHVDINSMVHRDQEENVSRELVSGEGTPKLMRPLSETLNCVSWSRRRASHKPELENGNSHKKPQRLPSEGEIFHTGGTEPSSGESPTKGKPERPILPGQPKITEP